MAIVLLVAHAPTEGTRTLRDALAAGAGDELIEDVTVVVRTPLETTADDLNAADGVLLLSTANFGYMAGLVKDLFDRTFLAIGGSLGADGGSAPGAGGRKPFGLCVHGRYDTEGAVRSITSIVGALPWRLAAPVLALLGEVGEAESAAAHELGATVSALTAEVSA